MSLIRIAVAGLALCASASVASAQGTPPQGHDGHHGDKSAMPQKHGKVGMHKMILKGITLTADQQAKLDAIHAKHSAAMGPMSPDGTRPDENARAKMRADMEAQYGEIRAILTPDQQKVFDANLEEMKQLREKRKSTQPKT